MGEGHGDTGKGLVATMAQIVDPRIDAADGLIHAIAEGIQLRADITTLAST